MNDILKLLNQLPDLVHLEPAPEASVCLAEQALGIPFAPDYRAYVKACGAACAGSMELTGVTGTGRLDVVSVTRKARQALGLPRKFYVVEELGIDDILTLQDSGGTVYTLQPGSPVRRLCSSLTLYLQQRCR